MKKVLQTTITTIALALGSGVANASVWTAGLSYDGVEDQVQDNSVSFAISDGGVVGVVDAGDVIVGTIKWNTNTSDAVPFGDHAMAVFAATVLVDNGAGTNVIAGDPTINFTLGPATATLAGLLPTIDAGVGGFSLGTLGVVLSGGGTDPTTLPPFGAGGAYGLGNALDGFAIDLEFGFSAPTDYFEAELRDHNTPGVISISDGDADGYIDEYDDFVGAGPGAFLAGVTTGLESGGFSILRDFTSGAMYLPVSTVNLAGALVGTADIRLDPSTTLVQPNQGVVDNGYAFADQSIVTLNALPEPNVLALFGIGLAGLGLMRRSKGKTA